MKLLIALDNGTTQEVEAEIIQIGKWKCFFHQLSSNILVETDIFAISELSSGMRISSSYFKEFSIITATQLLDSHDERTIQRHCKGILQHAGHTKYPINN